MPGRPQSIINQVKLHDSLCLCLASVHLPYPFQLIFASQLQDDTVLQTLTKKGRLCFLRGFAGEPPHQLGHGRDLVDLVYTRAAEHQAALAARRLKQSVGQAVGRGIRMA